MANNAPLPEFRDLDEEFFQAACENAVVSPRIRNLIVEFTEKQAWAAVDLKEEKVEEYINLERDKEKSTIWINIWAPHKQRAIVKALQTKYKFSPRLAGIMRSDPPTRRSASAINPKEKVYQQERTKLARPLYDLSPPAERFHFGSDQKGSLISDPTPYVELNHYKMVSQVWHYYSVDPGAHYLCIGYNTLCATGEVSDEELRTISNSAESTARTQDNLENKPKGIRIWNWLILCDDRTVISIYENPSADQGPVDRDEKDLGFIRRNLLNILKQLSKASNVYRENNPVYTLDIRPFSASSHLQTISMDESPSMLFYYLFDDWYSSYALVSKVEHPYAKSLEQLRQKMFKKPDVDLIENLHRFGRELSVLKRMYESYALIIERILRRQKTSVEQDGNNSRLNDGSSGQVFPNASKSSGQEELQKSSGKEFEFASRYGTSLCPAAAARFERLRDRINHFAISEIQECLDEKEGLVFLNFNMIALKESQAVERLTRITILLAKVTILFMPVSLLSAYFSIQLPEISQYSIKSYWIAFGVIMALSFIFLMIFGALSGTLEGKPIYRSFTQTVFDWGKERKGKRLRGRNNSV